MSKVDDIAASLRIVKGAPTAEQIAAVVAALNIAAVQASQGMSAEQPQRSRWGIPHLRGSLPHGPDAWRHALRNR